MFGKPVMISEANVEFSNRYEVMSDLAAFVASNRWIRAIIWSQTTSRGQHDWAGTRMEWPLRGDDQALAILESMR